MNNSFRRIASAGAAAIFVLAVGIPATSPRLLAQAPTPQELIGYPQTMFVNGKVLTVDKNFTIAQAIAIRDGKVLATGTTAAIEKLAGPKTQKIDLAGKTIIPGIIDTHLHFQLSAMYNHAKEIGALEPRFADYFSDQGGGPPPAVAALGIGGPGNAAPGAWVGGSTVAEVMENIKKIVDGRKPGTWVTVKLSNAAMSAPFADKIKRKELDAIAPNNLLIVKARDTIINTKLVMAIKSFYGFMPVEYPIDSEGLLAGPIDVVLEESLVGDMLIDHPMQSLYPAFRTEMAAWASYGLTTDSCRLIGLWFEPVYAEMARRGEMPMRLAYSALGTQVFPYAADFYKRIGDVTGMGNDMLWMAGVGVVHIDLRACSSLSPTKEPCFLDKPSALKYKALFEAVKYGNRIVNTHVSGDLAADQLMDLIEKASAAGGMTQAQIQERHHGMDHCSMNPRPDQIERGKKLGILWACAAGLAGIEGAANVASEYGEEYANKWVVPVGSIIKAGGRVAGHGEGMKGDSYFTYPEEMLTRKDSKGRIWGAKEAIDRKDLLRMYTTWAADYVVKPDKLGSLEPGKFADLVILDKDYMTLPIEEFHTMHPVMTMLGGKVVYQKDAK